MKIYFASFLLLSSASTASAFAPSSRAFVRPASVSTSSALQMQDTAEAIAAAREASEKFGKTSPEARMAWELVEELDAANSHEKQMAQEIAKREAEIDRLQKQKEAAAVPAAPIVHADTSEAVKNALEASRVFGKTSREAQLAWDIVEEVAAANSRHRVDDIHVAKIIPAEPEATPTTTKATTSVPRTVDEAVDAAMLASKIYGTHSTEARVAWELVEELDSAISHKKDDIKAADAAAAKAVVPEKKPVEQRSVHMDTSDAIKAALQASQEFGKTSPEARIAWERVEEIDAANAHHKTVGSG